MNANDFLTNNRYLILPTKANPKVYLPLDNKESIINGFKLYNPFSKKAKIFKKIIVFTMQKTPFIGRFLFSTFKSNQSDFSKFLNKSTNLNLTVGLYVATAKDKVVLQLQNNHKVYGYLKFPISTLGKKRLINEQKAIKILSKLDIVAPLLFNGIYNNIPFIITDNIEGNIGEIEGLVYKNILNSFKKNNSFLLKNHPRVLSLLSKMEQKELKDYKPRLLFALNKTTNVYKEVYEHGDFAPWNLIKTNNNLIPFDFEYFEEQGLEYLDEIKYHFQIQNLLNKKEGIILLQELKDIMALEDFNLLFSLFLIKEIIQKKKDNLSIQPEITLFKLLENE